MLTVRMAIGAIVDARVKVIDAFRHADVQTVLDYATANHPGIPIECFIIPRDAKSWIVEQGRRYEFRAAVAALERLDRGWVRWDPRQEYPTVGVFDYKPGDATLDAINEYLRDWGYAVRVQRASACNAINLIYG